MGSVPVADMTYGRICADAKLSFKRLHLINIINGVFELKMYFTIIFPSEKEYYSHIWINRVSMFIAIQTISKYEKPLITASWIKRKFINGEQE